MTTIKKDNTPKAVLDCRELLKWMIPQLDKFPRSRRFTLGERLETGLIDVLESLVEAAYCQDKQRWLSRANRRLETARHLWRLSFELKTVSPKSYHFGGQLMVELGRQIGGWLKHLQRVKP